MAIVTLTIAIVLPLRWDRFFASARIYNTLPIFQRVSHARWVSFMRSPCSPSLHMGLKKLRPQAG
jgi:hypothetical protein